MKHEKRTRIADAAALARYLPAAVVHHLLAPGSTPAPALELASAAARLHDLRQMVVTYVPEHAGIAQRVPHAQCAGNLSRIAGTLLVADLSGFTAFSARLSLLGTEGAELVARTVSDLFSALIGALAGWGGSLLKLSGDALTALFSGPDHAGYAVAAALELQARMAAFQALVTPMGVFALRLRIGLASGDIMLAEVGTAERVELLVAGATARRAIEIQRLAPPGTVLAGAEMHQEIAARCRALTLTSGHYQVQAIDPPERPPASAPRAWTTRCDPAWELHALVARLDALRPYLVDQHLLRLADGPPALAGAGELRPVTVLFACLSDAGPLLERAAPGGDDPALAPLLAHAQRLWDIVARHGGTINKLDLHADGHTLVALFGAPIAQGHEAERAVSCALALLEEAAAQGGTGPLLARRVGLATGRVFAGAVGSAERREYTVMGSVVNLAARLMDVVGEGHALIDAITAHAVRRLFRLHEQPPALIKGYEKPIAFYRVAIERRPRLRVLLRDRGPLVGRGAELARAQARAAEALAGRGAVVALVGEAGIGKSRLLAEIIRSLPVGGAGAPLWMLAVVHGQPAGRGQPYAVVADLLRQLYTLPEQPGPAATALATLVAERASEHERFLPLLLAMFGLPGAESALTQALTPEERRERLHALVTALLIAHTRAWPTVLALEDLHWADAPSLALLGELAAACTALPLLVLCTCRADMAPVWPASADVASIHLHGLTPEQSAVLLGEWLGGPVPDDVCAAAAARAQGNPFFVEEIARALRERGPHIGDLDPLPATIQGALLARLDRLSSEERYIVQVAAVIGPIVPRALLARIAQVPVALDRALERLTAAGLLRSDGDGHYAFAHSLTQETAYQSLLFAQRRHLHRRVADRLHADDPETANEEPGLLAYHYRQAEAWAEALEYAWQAGVRAQALYAGDVALGHYRDALDAARQLGAAGTRRHPAILRQIGDLHSLAGRYAGAIVAYQQALAASVDGRERAEILISWAEVCEQQATYDEALALLDQASAALMGLSEEALTLRVRVRRGWVLVLRGAAEEARAAVEPCLERLEEQAQWKDLLLGYKVFFQIALDQSRWREARAYLRLALGCAEQIGNMREIARIYNNMGVVLTHEGDLQRAAQSLVRSAQIMREIDDRYGMALINGNIGVTHYKLGDNATALRYYQESLESATAIGALMLEASARMNIGEIARRMQQYDASCDQLLRSIAIWQQIADEGGLAEAYRQLTETYIALGRLDEARQYCEQAYATALTASDAQTQAIVYRVRGLLKAMRGDFSAALADTQRSIRMLADLGSTHELGQSMVLQARVLTQTGQPAAARATLKEAIQLFQKAGAEADRAQAQRLLNTTDRHWNINQLAEF